MNDKNFRVAKIKILSIIRYQLSIKIIRFAIFKYKIQLIVNKRMMCVIHFQLDIIN